MPEKPSESKVSIRNSYLQRRSLLKASDVRDFSAKLCTRLLAEISVREGDCLAGFWPMRNEPDLRAAFDIMSENHVPLALPWCDAAGKHMHFRSYHPNDPMRRHSNFGFYQPRDEVPEAIPTIILLPLVAFDRTGNRLGYGKGMYDKMLGDPIFKTSFLSHDAKSSSVRPDSGSAYQYPLARPLLIGIGFSALEHPSLPAEEHDIRMHWILTEKETIRIT